MASRNDGATAIIPTQVLFDTGLKPSERATLTAIHAMARPRDGFAAVTATQLGEAMGVSHWSIRKHIRDLEAVGYVRRGHQHEHGPVIGACPKFGCYGIFVALRSSGRPYDWASGVPAAAPELMERAAKILAG